jgi:adenylate cyclase
MRPSKPYQPRVTLFITILTLFLFVALLVGTAITAANFVETRGTAERVAADAFAATIDRIDARRQALFAPVFQMAELLRDDAATKRPDEAKEAMLHLALPGLTLNPQISSIYAGYANGNFLQIMSVADAEKPFIARLGGPAVTRFVVREIGADEDGARIESWRFLQGDGRQIGPPLSGAATYDPRDRDWYRDAMADKSNFVRTPPYIFAASSEVGMTVARAFAGGAVGVDVTLDRLNAFVRSVRPSETHRFVTFDNHDRLMFHFNPERMFARAASDGAETVRLATMADLPDPVIQEAYLMFKRSGPFRLARFAIAGTEYLATVNSNVGRDGSAFYELYAAPASDFQGSLAGTAQRSVLIALLLLVLMLPAIIYLAGSLSKPLGRLSREAELIRSFQLNEPIEMKSRVREIHTLIASMAGMKGTIREVSKFVPKALVKDILDSGGVVRVGGEMRRVSIMFTDVKDFTPMAQAIPAEELMVNLSTYFEELASLIIGENGTVDKFIGDAIFAFWNAPLPVARHEHAACLTALKCRAASERLNARWAKASLPPWHTRFGVHVGDAVLGNVGSSDRIDYTAIGDTVNIASRLEGLNKFYGTGILASGEIATICADQFLFRRLDRGLPKGSGEPLEVFELLAVVDGPKELCATAATRKFARDWNTFCEMYAGHEWRRALETLEVFAREYPNDVVAAIYRDRVEGFLHRPPPRDWDGITRFDTK